MINLFTTGFILGFSIAAPVGPIGILCIQRTLNRRQIYGLVSGLGAATADAVYGFIAAFGLTMITGFLVAQSNILRFVGGIFLCYLGVKTFLASVSAYSNTTSTETLRDAYLSTFFLTLTNPMTILSFAAIFAGVGLTNRGGDYLSASLLVLGVFVGSGLWWLLLSGGVGLFRSKFNPRGLQWINRGAGVIIAVFGLIILLSLWRDFV